MKTETTPQRVTYANTLWKLTEEKETTDPELSSVRLIFEEAEEDDGSDYKELSLESVFMVRNFPVRVYSFSRYYNSKSGGHILDVFALPPTSFEKYSSQEIARKAYLTAVPAMIKMLEKGNQEGGEKS